MGTVANVVLLTAVAYGFPSRGPLSLRAEFERRLARVRPPVRAASSGAILDGDLASLPDPVQRYLRRSGVVGRPAGRDRLPGNLDRPHSTITARRCGCDCCLCGQWSMRRATCASWLPAPCFHQKLRGSRSTSAPPRRTSLSGPTPSRPSCGSTIWGILLTSSPTGVGTCRRTGTHTPLRRSTPLHDYAQVGPARAATKADARWHPDSGAWTCGESELTSLAYNVANRRATPPDETPYRHG